MEKEDFMIHFDEMLGLNVNRFMPAGISIPKSGTVITSRAARDTEQALDYAI
jgi:hypothetical protein